MDVAERIYRFGVDNQQQNFGGNLSYVLEYLDFMEHLPEVCRVRIYHARDGTAQCDVSPLNRIIIHGSSLSAY